METTNAAYTNCGMRSNFQRLDRSMMQPSYLMHSANKFVDTIILPATAPTGS